MARSAAAPPRPGAVPPRENVSPRCAAGAPVDLGQHAGGAAPSRRCEQQQNECAAPADRGDPEEQARFVRGASLSA